MSEFLAGLFLGFLAHYVIDGIKAVRDIRRDNRLAGEIDKHFHEYMDRNK